MEREEEMQRRIMVDTSSPSGEEGREGARGGEREVEKRGKPSATRRWYSWRRTA